MFHRPYGERRCIALTYFHDLSAAHQSLLLCCMFAPILPALFCMHLSRFGKRRITLRSVCAALLLVLFACVVLCGREAQDALSFRPFPVPVWALWSISLLTCALFVTVAVGLVHRRRNTIGPHSIRQAMDTLPSGICFFNPDGTVKLCNLQMYRLFRTLTQSDLQSLDELCAAVHAPRTDSGVVPLRNAKQTLLFPDGTVWQYTQTAVTTKKGEVYTEALFSDVTALYEKQQELKRRNAALKAVYSDIKRLSDSVLEMTKESEILSAKTNLHDQMGAGITAIRQSLRRSQTSAENTEAIALLRKAVRILRNDNESPVGRTDTQELIHNAQAIGIRVDMTGEFPPNEQLHRLFLLTVKECCTNAARHAGAQTLTVHMTQSAAQYVLHIENDGKAPEGEVVPKGGLSNLMHAFSAFGGTLTIRSAPTFALTAAVPAAAPEEVL